MNSELLLGIDIGTNGVKGALVAPTGKVVARSLIEHGCRYPRPDWCEHDMTQNWWCNPVRAIRSLLQTGRIKPDQVKAIGISGLFPALGPTDENGIPLYGAILYSDNRSVNEVAEVNAAIGLQLTSEELTPKLIWFQRNEPELASKVSMFFDAPHYLVYKLCGAYVTDTILAGRYGAIYQSPSAEWRSGVCEQFGIPLEILPAVHLPAQIVGTVHAKAAQETGLAVGTPVLTGIPDLVATLISAGAVRTTESIAYYGSAGLVPFMKQDLIRAIWHPYPNEERGVVPLDGYLFDFPVYSLSVGEAARWFRDQFAAVEAAVERKSGVNAFKRLHGLAAAVRPGSAGLIMLPYLQGQRSPDFNPSASGVFFGVKNVHTRETFFRAVLESFGYSIRHGLESSYPGGSPLRRLVATGGGARSPLWRQIVSDITGIRQEYVPDVDEAIGDAYLAGLALGWFDDFGPLQKEWVKVVDITEPDAGVQEIYDRYYSIYVELHTALKPVFQQHHLTHTPLEGNHV